MERDPRASLWDVERAARTVAGFIAGRDYAGYLADTMLRSAVERQCESIGEALAQLAKEDPALAARIPTCVRRSACGMS